MSKERELSELRGLLAEPTQDDGWNEAFCALLFSVHKDPSYRDVWLPYCEEHASVLRKPIKQVSSIEALGEWVAIAPFAHFSLVCSDELSTEECEMMARSGLLQSVSHLWLYFGAIDVTGCEILLRAGSFDHMELLDFSENEWGYKGCELLASHGTFARLKHLNLSDNKVDAEGIKLLCSSVCFPHLETLDLSMNGFGPAGAAALVEAKGLPNLRHLKLSGNDLRDEGAGYIAHSHHMEHLHSLLLGNNGITVEGCKHIASSESFCELSLLDVHDNDFGEYDNSGFLAIVLSVTLPVKARLAGMGPFGVDVFVELAQEYGIEADESMSKYEVVDLIWAEREKERNAEDCPTRTLMRRLYQMTIPALRAEAKQAKIAQNPKKLTRDGLIAHLCEVLC